MERSQSYDDQDPRDEQMGGVSEEAVEVSTDTSAAAEGQEALALPSQDDLESQGFTPEQVRRLVVVSDRAADSSESRAAEAEMRRLRFTRWLIDHGVLDEWSA